MIFTTLNFLIFLVIVFFIYYLVPKKFRWIVLLLASIYFYVASSPKYIIYVLISSFITYLGARIITKLDDDNRKNIESKSEEIPKEIKKILKKGLARKKKTVIVITIIGALSMLVVMKYTGFILENISRIYNIIGFDFKGPAWNIILPIGISFYTFMSIGYAIDVYRGEYPAEKNFFKYFLYISYFPHVLQGPIDSYKDLSEEFNKPKSFNYEETVQGLSRVGIGLIKKMVIADKIAPVVTGVITGIDGYFGKNIIIAIVLYAIELYADFSGYMDIAIGCSRMLGIKLTENFDSPYFSKSIAEYWRRWHMSLGAWFRDYVYYPLLRSKRAEKIRKYYKESNNKFLANNMPTVFALSILWILIGFWHGSTWAFILYGMYHGLIIIISTLLSPLYTKFYKRFPKLVKTKIYGFFQICRTFCLVLIGYFLFVTGDLNIAAQMVKNMFLFGKNSISLRAQTTFDFKISLLIGLIIIFALDVLGYLKIDVYSKIRKLPIVIRWLIYATGIFIIMMLSSGEPQEFLYFKF